MKRLTILLAVAMLGLLAAQAPQAAPANGGKWVVLRNPHSSNCWTAVVIQVNGQYATASAHVAGGPYDTEDQAKKRLSELATLGTCRSS